MGFYFLDLFNIPGSYSILGLTFSQILEHLGNYFLKYFLPSIYLKKFLSGGSVIWMLNFQLVFIFQLNTHPHTQLNIHICVYYVNDYTSS